MCVRKENEPFWAYAARWVVEQPRAVLSVIGFGAAAVMYCDLKDYLQVQHAAQAETVKVLTELSERMQTIERRIDSLQHPNEGPGSRQP